MIARSDSPADRIVPTNTVVDRSWALLLSHELGGPIALLRGYASVWSEDGPPQLQELGRQALPDANALATGLHDLLEAGRSLPEASDADLVAAVGRFGWDARPLVQRLQATLQGWLQVAGGSGRRQGTFSVETCYAQTLLLSGLFDQLALAVGLDAHAARDWQVVDVATWVRRLAHGIAGALTATGHRLLVEADRGAADALVTPDLLQAAVLNLLDNAQKHSPAGLPISVAVSATAEAVLIRVSDRGPGLPEGLVPTLFTRVDHASAFDQPGLGLGLTIAARVAQMNGGELQHARRPGGGSVFTIMLPRQT